MNGTPPDPELLARLAAGDTAALEPLYVRHSDCLRGIALRVVCDPELAADIMHDVFAVLQGRAGQYRKECGAVSTWLGAMVRNLSIDRMRAQQRREKPEWLGRCVMETAPCPRETAVSSDEAEIIRGCVDSLPPLHREPVALAFYQGLTYAEVAARLQSPLNTVKSRIRRGLDALNHLPALRTVLCCLALLLTTLPASTQTAVSASTVKLLLWDPVPGALYYQIEYRHEDSLGWSRNGPYKTTSADIPVMRPGVWYFRVVGVVANDPGGEVRTEPGNEILIEF